MVNVSYKGGATVVTALMGGEVDMAFFPPVAGHLRTGERGKAENPGHHVEDTLPPDAPEYTDGRGSRRPPRISR